MRKRTYYDYATLRVNEEQLQLIMNGIQLVRGSSTGFPHLQSLIEDCDRITERCKVKLQRLRSKNPQ